MKKLTVLSVRAARTGRHCDGLGLYLVVRPSGSRSWVLRVQHHGRRRDIGLGSVDLEPRTGSLPGADIDLLRRRVLTLAEARDKSALLRKFALAGLDPVAERDREARHVPTFREAVELAHDEFAKGWSAKHAATFKSSLLTHVIPHLGAVRVDEIDLGMVTASLADIWSAKPAMGQKLRIRINQVLGFCQARNWRSQIAPAAGDVRKGLAKPKRPAHFAAMPFRDVPQFMARINGAADTLGRLALAFVILTAARSGEVRQARWDTIDLKAKTWNRPAEIMKMQVAHSVPLSPPALAVLERARRFSNGTGLVFPGRHGRPLGDMTIAKALQFEGVSNATVHGFRSSFRDWAAELMPHIPTIVPEMALAHQVGNAAERAYLRSDLLGLRRDLMSAWGAYLQVL